MSGESSLSIKNVTIFGGGQMGSGIAHVSFDLIYYSLTFVEQGGIAGQSCSYLLFTISARIA